jgi:hypothetical protein
MKEDLTKALEILKLNQIKILEMKNLISQIKISVESLISRLDQVGDWIPGLKDKVDKLKHSNCDKEKR